MIGRSAREFDEAWESGAHSGGSIHSSVAHLVGVAGRLSEAAATVAPSEEFRCGLRTLLLARANEIPVAAASARPARRALPVVSKISVAGFAAAGALGLVAASAQALPGDPLYPVKRAIESALVAIQPSEAGKSHGHLDAAGHRLAEAARLAGEGSPSARNKVAESLASFVTSGDEAFAALTRGGLDASTADQVSDFVATSSLTLRQLEPHLPTNARDEFADATSLLDELGTLLPGPPATRLGDGLAAPQDVPSGSLSASATAQGAKPALDLTGSLKKGTGPAPELAEPVTSPEPGVTDSLTSDIDGVIPGLLGSLLN
jgi:hypothetical protein